MKIAGKKNHRLFVPEVVQTSAMDCGPACLKSLLEGFGIPVSLGRLREACQTDVDGTSIDTLEEVANQLGLKAEQIMIPADHLLVPETEALPGLLVVQLARGITHFVVIWSQYNGLVQVMDPASGRVWKSKQQLLNEVYIHKMPVLAADWREWAGSGEFLGVLQKRLAALGLTSAITGQLIGRAQADNKWFTFATLDAATRLTQALLNSNGLKPGAEASNLLISLFEEALQTNSSECNNSAIPGNYWSVRPIEPEESDEAEEPQLLLQGAVLLRIQGVHKAAPATELFDLTRDAAEAESMQPELPPHLSAALEEKTEWPGLELLKMLRSEGLLRLSTLGTALLLAGAGFIIQTLLLRGLIDLGTLLPQPELRLLAMILLLGFLVSLFLIDLPVTSGVLRLGRRLETRFRFSILEKMPRLRDRYFQSRLVSDMVERSHSIYQVRLLPGMGGRVLILVGELLCTTAGLIWLDPGSTLAVLVMLACALTLPFLPQPFLLGPELKVRTHNAALGQFYLDGMLGLSAVRAHKAEKSLRAEHEKLLAEWNTASYRLHLVKTLTEGLQFSLIFALVSWLVFDHIGRATNTGTTLLFVYWAINVFAVAVELVPIARQYPVYRNTTLRLLELLTTPEETPSSDNNFKAEKGTIVSGSTSLTSTMLQKSPIAKNLLQETSGAIAIKLENVTVRAAGHTILEDINLQIEPGSHVAIVGPSGAGKSSLVGLLLGWHQPAEGAVFVNDLLLDNERLGELRQHTAWVDPAVQLWNQSLLENLRYGTLPNATLPLNQIIQLSNLQSVLEKLPDGLQTRLGEGGALVSGGEGQRVRLARAMLRPDVKLVILDEPFRGVDREKRRELLAKARELWEPVTLLCVTHDLAETAQFERVLVVENGRIVEDGKPAVLAAQPDSRYKALLEVEQELQQLFLSGTEWRRLWVEKGRILEEDRNNDLISGGR